MLVELQHALAVEERHTDCATAKKAKAETEAETVDKLLKLKKPLDLKIYTNVFIIQSQDCLAMYASID